MKLSCFFGHNFELLHSFTIIEATKFIWSKDWDEVEVLMLIYRCKRCGKGKALLDVGTKTKKYSFTYACALYERTKKYSPERIVNQCKQNKEEK